MAIKIIAIVIKIIITVIKKINSIKANGKSLSKVIIVKGIYVQIMTMPSKKFKKPSYRQTLPLQVQRSKGAKNRAFHTLSPI